MADCIVYNSLWIYNISQYGKWIQKHQFIIVRTLHCLWIMIFELISFYELVMEFTEHPGTPTFWIISVLFDEFRRKDHIFQSNFRHRSGNPKKKKEEGIQSIPWNVAFGNGNSISNLHFDRWSFLLIFYCLSITLCDGMGSVCFLVGDKNEHFNGIGVLSAFTLWMYALNCAVSILR